MVHWYAYSSLEVQGLEYIYKYAYIMYIYLYAHKFSFEFDAVVLMR